MYSQWLVDWVVSQSAFTPHVAGALPTRTFESSVLGGGPKTGSNWRLLGRSNKHWRVRKDRNPKV